MIHLRGGKRLRKLKCRAAYTEMGGGYTGKDLLMNSGGRSSKVTAPVFKSRITSAIETAPIAICFLKFSRVTFVVDSRVTFFLKKKNRLLNSSKAATEIG